ncbi:hypothetical protein HELRODRAFT_165311 [Helobdella robusta]|uniref:Uncharacterized protein n=1 Tax=Helobdella robusta TaxID=6412 RepID=T1EWK8_HELRO|nr:hypothetical protein HELRODRAFT_165311 [Helobdella robusta]ESN91302.1 hypothetical protein HELRODRAFT_165311 [Helobdella robusta]
MNLEGMKYADLQKLAKSYGIKGNQKEKYCTYSIVIVGKPLPAIGQTYVSSLTGLSDKLIEALKKIFDIDNCKNSASSNNDQEDKGNALQEVSKCIGENVPPSNGDICAVFSKCSTLNASNDLNSKENEIKKENKIKSTVKRKTFDSDETCAEHKKDPCIVKDNQIGSVSAEIVEVEMQISAKRGRMSKDDTAKTSINQNCGEVLDGENNRDDDNDLPMKKKLRSSYDKKPSNGLPTALPDTLTYQQHLFVSNLYLLYYQNLKPSAFKRVHLKSNIDGSAVSRRHMFCLVHAYSFELNIIRIKHDIPLCC